MKRMDDKVDTGFCPVYFKLSYRRKFIRVLWTAPACLAFIALYLPKDFVMFGVTRFAMLAILAVVFLLQLIYNYVKWNRHERTEGKSVWRSLEVGGNQQSSA